jgi:hypothetical protein
MYCLVFASLGAICIYVPSLNPEKNLQTISQAERLNPGHIESGGASIHD